MALEHERGRRPFDGFGDAVVDPEDDRTHHLHLFFERMLLVHEPGVDVGIDRHPASLPGPELAHQIGRGSIEERREKGGLVGRRR